MFRFIRSSKLTSEKIIVMFFSLLPLVDMLNGMMGSIGTFYKAFLCVLLFLVVAKKNRMRKTGLIAILVSVSYVVFTITVNTMVFGNSVINYDFPVKLIFNIVLLVLIKESLTAGVLKERSLFEILDNTTWVLVLCYLVPYAMGLGNTVYSGEIGYKGFYISQNELSLVLITMCFFCAYKIAAMPRVSLISFVQIGMVLLSAILLNTKSTLVACAVAAIALIITLVMKGNTKIKIASTAAIIVVIIAMKDTFISAVISVVNRFNVLKGMYYGDSVFTAVLSGRNKLANSAWDELNREHFLFKLFFGNGFCSNYLTEMDVVDAFFYLGIIGALSLTVFLVIVFGKGMSTAKEDGNIIRAVSIVVIIGFTVLTGHVVFYAMSGCFAVIYVCFITSNNATNVRKTRHAEILEGSYD